MAITPTETITPSLVPPLPALPTAVPTLSVSDGLLQLLLIGGDRDYVPDMNTDTLIVVVINKDTKQVSLLSIPRDLWVYIPTYGWGRINIAHRIGARFDYADGRGPGLLMRTIEENLGVPIDHWVRISYDGFARAVDELGGVEMTVACPVNLRYQPPSSDEEQELRLAPGVYHMDGATALRYVRTRRGTSDFERARRQQQFLKTVWKQFKSPKIITRIPALWSALKGSFATDLDLGDVLALVPVALDLEPQRVRSRYIGSGQVISWTTPDGASVLLPQFDKVRPLIESLYASPSAMSDEAAREGARVQVQNGTHRPQLGRIAADQLQWYGLQITETGPADSGEYKETQIIVVNDKPAALDTLVRVLQVKPQNVIRQLEPGQREALVQVDLIVILGADYNPCP